MFRITRPGILAALGYGILFSAPGFTFNVHDNVGCRPPLSLDTKRFPSSLRMAGFQGPVKTIHSSQNFSFRNQPPSTGTTVTRFNKNGLLTELTSHRVKTKAGNVVSKTLVERRDLRTGRSRILEKHYASYDGSKQKQRNKMESVYLYNSGKRVFTELLKADSGIRSRREQYFNHQGIIQREQSVLIDPDQSKRQIFSTLHPLARQSDKNLLRLTAESKTYRVNKGVKQLEARRRLSFVYHLKENKSETVEQACDNPKRHCATVGISIVRCTDFDQHNNPRKIVWQSMDHKRNILHSVVSNLRYEYHTK